MAPCNTSINKMYEAQQNTKITPRTNKKNIAVKLWQRPIYEVASGSRNPKINLHRKQFVTVLFQSRAKANIVFARINYGPSVVATT